MKDKNNIFIMGDSYSTYKGFNPQEYRTYYFDGRDKDPIIRGFERTWWHMVAEENNLNIVLNDSFSGSTVCNTVRDKWSVDSSFVSRMDKYISENFFAENEIETVFIFGGTNDSWIDAPIGNIKYSGWNSDDLKCILPAFCYLIDTVKKAVKNVFVIINCDIKEEITNGFKEICEKNSIKYLHLKDIDKENNHPTELGMKQIAKQVSNSFDKYI